MNNLGKFKILKSEKGVSLIITFFIMIIILVVVLSISALLYSEVKVIRNIGNSVVAFYAADSGVEKVLYYDRQVIPSGATIGLCSISTNCLTSGSGDHSIYCNNSPSTIYSDTSNTLYDSSREDSSKGCDPATCDDCQISFSTTMDDGITYITTAEIYPSTGGGSIFEIKSKGDFEGVERQIQVNETH